MKRAAIETSLAAVFFCGLCVLALAGSALAGSPAAESLWTPLVDRLAADGLERRKVTYFFSSPDLEFQPEIMARKMNVLLHTKLSARKPGPQPEPQVMDRYLNPLLIAGAYAFYREHRAELTLIHEQYGVPGEILTALMLIESRLGMTVGDYNAFTILASMALAGDFELIRDRIDNVDTSAEIMDWLVKRTREKGDWAYKELKALIRYAQASGQDPLTIRSSVYGAIGLCQFMPTSAEHYGRDGSGDGLVDLFDTRDALYSMANFVAEHGWKDSMTEEQKQKVLYRYNHSESYAMTVLAVADRISKTRELFGG
ncbi:lytic murein transglycosylase [uncultured Pseudodesulfovibrio sp.]|uniref:lytic murein transglycosylase n=1 Tax=uncultured Pseudodesulfovibrio sp. TaxID=2035858 RepID=UPI0029C60A7D|nr:lytic murein transglycosylase [uncultured Pseudodesulfovibrio sp.]